MSLINDVNREVVKLDLSVKNLRNFGLVIGGVFLLIFLFLSYRDATPALRVFSVFAGVLLIVSGTLIPAKLGPVYRVWMCLALGIGWFVSRILLAVIFFFMLTPLGLLSKLAGKDFLNVSQKSVQESYWVRRNNGRDPNYEKLH